MDERLRLVEQEIPRLRRYARLLVRDADRADDLVQECLVRAINKIDSWKIGSSMRAWLFVILRNVFINEIRRSKIGPLYGELPANHPSLTVSGGQEERQSLIQLQSAFDRLPESQREVILLVAIEGFGYEEAAQILHIPVGTVRSRLSRARTTLQEIFQEPHQPGGGG